MLTVCAHGVVLKMILVEEMALKMRTETLGLLVMSSALNAALGFFVLVFAEYSTGPDMADFTLRIGFYVLNAVAVAAAAAVFLPWFFTRKNHTRRAVFFASLPFVTLLIALVVFLTLGSWLNGTFL